MRLFIALALVATLASSASAQTATPTSTPTDTPTHTPTVTPTPTMRPTYAAFRSGSLPIGVTYKQTNQAITDNTAVALLDYPGTTARNCVEWIEVSANEATVVSLVSASLTIDIPFAAAGYHFLDWRNRCFPVGEIVSLDQTGDGTNSVKVNVSYFQR